MKVKTTQRIFTAFLLFSQLICSTQAFEPIGAAPVIPDQITNSRPNVASFYLFDPEQLFFSGLNYVMDHIYDGIVPFIIREKGEIISSFWNIEGSVGCSSCKMASWLLQRFNNGFVRWALNEAVILICDIVTPFVDMGYGSGICRGLVTDQFYEEGYPILTDKLLTERSLCTFILELCDMEKWKKIDVKEWVEDKVSSKPKIAQHNNFVNNLYHDFQLKESKKEPIKIVMFADLHIDYDYTPGTSSECGKILCCRSDSGPPKGPADTAGYWGDYKCDPPDQLVQSMFKFMTEEIQPHLAFWGGDSIPHNADTLSMESSIYTMKKISEQVNKAFDGVKVYATLGNHDTYPLDSFSGYTPQENEALTAWAPAWDVFTDSAKERKTFIDFGYYSTPLTFKNGTLIGETKSKLISFNSNFCFFNNFHQYAQFKDPGDIFKWLESELLELEKVGGAAIMLSHVPNVDECNRQFGKRWHALMDRFQHVVRWGMAAHVHSQMWQVQRDVIGKQPIGVNFIVGSVTPYQVAGYGKQPNFQVLTMDPDTLIPLEIETYAFDLDYANQNNQPKWYRAFSDRETYELKDLSPQSYYEQATQISLNQQAAQRYRNHMEIDHIENPDQPCDADCRMSYYCRIVSNNYDDFQYCNENDKMDTFGKKQIMAFEDMIQHNWYEPIYE